MLKSIITRILPVVLTSLLGPISGAAWDYSPRFGPLLHSFPLIQTEGERVEAAGPFFYHQQADTRRIWAVPPLVSVARDPGLDSSDLDLVYPLMTFDRTGGEYRFQFLQLLSFSGGSNQEDNLRRRFTLFPVYFQQRSPDPAENYTAVFPLYGHLASRLLRDEIHFALWPAYIQSRKRDVVTDNYLYPLFHLRRGESLQGWQFWPLAGHEVKTTHTRNDSFGESETIGGHEKWFLLWPLFFNERTGLGTGNPAHRQVLLPLYSLERSPGRDSTTLLWPLFTYTDDRNRRYREWDLPWPLIVFARGEGKEVNRVWPLFSQARSGPKESSFYLWPLYKHNRLSAEPLERERTRLLFFLYSDVVERNTESGGSRQRRDLWPLFTASRDLEGCERLQILSVLEPFWPGSKSIERNYSPLWALWRSERHAATGVGSQSLLWNLYRRETTPESEKISLLLGLFQYQSEHDRARWRLFYIPLGKPAGKEIRPHTFREDPLN